MPLPKGLSLDDLYLDSPDLICFNLIVLTAVWPGLYSASGEYAYNKTLLRAGQLSEAIRLAAHTLGLPFRTIEEYDDQMLLRVLDIDPETESALMMIAI